MLSRTGRVAPLQVKLSTSLYGLVFDSDTGALREVCRDVRAE